MQFLLCCHRGRSVSGPHAIRAPQQRFHTQGGCAITKRGPFFGLDQVRRKAGCSLLGLNIFLYTIQTGSSQQKEALPWFDKSFSMWHSVQMLVVNVKSMKII